MTIDDIFLSHCTAPADSWIRHTSRHPVVVDGLLYRHVAHYLLNATLQNKRELRSRLADLFLSGVQSAPIAEEDVQTANSVLKAISGEKWAELLQKGLLAKALQNKDIDLTLRQGSDSTNDQLGKDLTDPGIRVLHAVWMDVAEEVRKPWSNADLLHYPAHLGNILDEQWARNCDVRRQMMERLDKLHQSMGHEWAWDKSSSHGRLKTRWSALQGIKEALGWKKSSPHGRLKTTLPPWLISAATVYNGHERFDSNCETISAFWEGWYEHLSLRSQIVYQGYFPAPTWADSTYWINIYGNKYDPWNGTWVKW